MNGATVRLGTSLVTLNRADNRFLQLQAGEVVRAEVAEVLPSGLLTLRIKGALVLARTEVPLPKEAGALFRVLNAPVGGANQEIRLQFLQLAEPAGAGVAGESPETAVISGLMQELAQSVTVSGPNPAGCGAIVANLLKALPADAQLLPKELRESLLTLLQTGLRATGQSLQNRMASLLGEPLLQDLEAQLSLGSLRDELLTDIGKLLQKPLKGPLDNTGVLLEARLRALLQAQPAQREPAQGGRPALMQPPSDPSAEGFDLKNDLKARLLQMKHLLADAATEKPSRPGLVSAAENNEAATGKASVARVAAAIDGLLGDIETLQLLSKLTDSHYTFLPILWKGLKDAEIAFKNNRGNSGSDSYYCLINLDFEELGKLTIVAMMQDKEFFVSFKTANSALQSVLDSNVQELQAMFRQQGLKLKAVNFLQRHETALAPLEALESFDNIINIKV